MAHPKTAPTAASHLEIGGGIRRASYKAARGGRVDGKVGAGAPQADLGVLTVSGVVANGILAEEGLWGEYPAREAGGCQTASDRKLAPGRLERPSRRGFPTPAAVRCWPPIWGSTARPIHRQRMTYPKGRRLAHSRKAILAVLRRVAAGRVATVASPLGWGRYLR
jgi:hypothetical protein